MKVLLVSATRFEIEPMFKLLKIRHPSSSGFHLKTVGKHEFNILITGPGMIATTYYLGNHLFETEYDLVINAGLAGSFRTEIELGSVVNVAEECFSDFGAEDDEDFIPVTELHFDGPDDFPLRQQTMLNESEINSITLLLLPKVKGITVNTVHGNEKSIERAVRIFNPDVESMEGAAVFYTCRNRGNIPFTEIRAVSNYVEKRDKRKWKTEKAVHNLCETLKGFLEEIK